LVIVSAIFLNPLLAFSALFLPCSPMFFTLSATPSTALFAADASTSNSTTYFLPSD